ncbi:MAG: ABC transporter, substrate-binding protein (cluster 10, nitrate/sulfonate/bicarbonate) [Firmicutes bacterium]|nr:ABC transporter, substrate-binding protein (cluster 10, nitrate/sulfonate/bicarbonate) [Bacillota bacterium]
MKPATRVSIFLLILVLVLGFVPGCTSSQELVTIRLNEVVRSIFYAPQYVALNKGFFEEEGLKVELYTGQGADKTMTALLSGQADIGFMGPEASIYVFNQGKDDYSVIFAQLTQRDGSFLVGRNPEPDFKWENLKGKSIIGGRPGGVPEMTLEYVLKQHGVDPFKDVEIITNLQFTATAGAFAGGTGDYVALFEPTASMLEAEGTGTIVASIGEAGGPIAYTAYSALKSYIEKNPEIIQKFTNAIYKGQLWVDQHTPEEIAREIEPFFPDTDIDLLATVVKRYKDQDTWCKNPVMIPETLDHLQDIIQTAGELDKVVPYDKIATTRFAEEAVKNIK